MKREYSLKDSFKDTKERLIYLSSPYSHEDEKIRKLRYDIACETTADLLTLGFLVYSPILHSAPLAESYSLPRIWNFWERIDREMLSRCQEVLVVTVDGWRESEGVQAEIEMAKEMGIPVRYTAHGVM